MSVNTYVAIKIEDAYDGFYITVGGTETFFCNQEDNASETLYKVFKFLGFEHVEIGEEC